MQCYRDAMYNTTYHLSTLRRHMRKPYRTRFLALDPEHEYTRRSFVIFFGLHNLSRQMSTQSLNRVLQNVSICRSALKGPSTLAFFASVSLSAMVPPPNCFLCAITYVIAREKQKKQLGSGAIAEGERDAKNASFFPCRCALLA
jgi:hypothetical protein